MSTDLTLSEINRILGAGGDPSAFVAIPVELLADVNAAKGAIVGDQHVVVLQLTFVMPRSAFRATSTVMDRTGRTPNPLNGMCPLLEARMVFPKEGLNPDLLAQMQAPELPPLPTLRRSESD